MCLRREKKKFLKRQEQLKPCPEPASPADGHLEMKKQLEVQWLCPQTRLQGQDSLSMGAGTLHCDNAKQLLH